MNAIKYKANEEIKRRIYTCRFYKARKDSVVKFDNVIGLEMDFESMDEAMRYANDVLHRMEIHHAVIEETTEYVGNEIHFNPLLTLMVWGA